MKRVVAATVLGLSMLVTAGNGQQVYTRPVIPQEDVLRRLNLVEAWHTHVPVEGKLDGVKTVQYLVALKLDRAGLEAARKAGVPDDVIKRVSPLTGEYFSTARSFLLELMNHMIPEEIEKFGITLMQQAIGKGDQLIVQTNSGIVVAIDPKDGRTIWRNRVGVKYMVSHPVAVNSHSIFVLRGLELFALNRKTGDRRWEYRLPEQPSAAIAADERHFFVPSGLNKLYAYELPVKHRRQLAQDKGMEYKPPVLASDVPAARAYEDRAGGYGVRGAGLADVANLKARQGHDPIYIWSYHADARLEAQPILSEDGVVIAGADGSFFIMAQTNNKVLGKFETQAPLAAPLGQHRLLLPDGQVIEMAYIASRDQNVYALNVVKGAVLWRFTGGAPILKQPAVTDNDVFVSAEGAGLYRVDRINGDTMWRNREALRFLSTNNRFVYATDRRGRLLVLDYATGKTRASYDTSGFDVPVINEWTDRVFLAANNGLILCLHDRHDKDPLRLKTLLEKKDSAQDVLKVKLKEEIERKKKEMEKEMQKN